MSKLLKKFVSVLTLKDNKSSSVAKDRLKLILLHDQLDISPQLMDKMRKELIGVVSKYMDFDPSGLKVEIEQENNLAMLVANIPIVKPREKLSAVRKG